MAKKTDNVVSMVDTFKEFKETKNIDRTTLMSVLEDSFRNVIARIYGSDENFKVIVNPDKGDFEIYRNRIVVENGMVEDENKEIELAEAQKIEADYEVGEEVIEPIDFNKFGRRAILTLRQTLASKILDLEHESQFNKFKDRVGELVSGEVYQVWKREVLIFDDEGNELLLPKSEQIGGDMRKGDNLRKGDTVRAVITRVTNDNNNPKVYISRTHPDFLRRLLENEVPEIAEGLITVHNIARLPGERAKIAVESYDERIDPVGACVGVKGARVHGIVRELCNENLDVINYSANPSTYIKRALAPADISNIRLDEENKKAEVYLAPDQVSLAIGRNGANIKLASLLTGYTIDVYRDTMDNEEEDDIILDEFNDEIDQWIIDAIKAIGFDTARQVLSAPREMLINKADLEEETVDHIMEVLRSEFE
ncbi:MAG: transcription termination/antitermination protein NusA [Bacteroidaceae bacterium]|nr:transcription termination/antitermination protein NusA [Bacteroidaceae bacterium]